MVMGVVLQGLGCDYDRLHELVNQHNTLRKFLGHSDIFDTRPYKYQTVMERSKISYQKWVMAIYLFTSSLKGVSLMKLHRDLGITQKSAWYMLQRLRMAFEQSPALFEGVVEVDETSIGGKDRNKHQKDVKAGRGSTGKAPVVGVKNRGTKQVRAKVIKNTQAKTLRDFVADNVVLGDATTVYTDVSFGYRKLPNQSAVKHSAN